MAAIAETAASTEIAAVSEIATIAKIAAIAEIAAIAGLVTVAYENKNRARLHATPKSSSQLTSSGVIIIRIFSKLIIMARSRMNSAVGYGIGTCARHVPCRCWVGSIGMMCV